jgi:hypothetical protein
VSSVADALAVIEFLGTFLVLGFLAVALLRRRLITVALVVAILFGIVFANPFGVVASSSSADARTLAPTEEADGARHWVKVAGVPVAWFTPYNDEHPFAFENSPSSTLKLRYGFSFLPSTGATSVVPQCANDIDVPCWKGRPDDYPLLHSDGDDRRYVVPLSQTLVVDQQGGTGSYPYVPHVYDVRLGLASRLALVYWLLVGGALVVALRRGRPRWRAIAIACGCSVAVGVVGSVIVATVPAEARSAESRTPPLLPGAAPAPSASGAAQIRSIEPVAEGCIVERSGYVPYNRCGQVDQLTAVETSGRALAVWTARRNDVTELRTRALSRAGEPIGSRSAIATSWQTVTASGEISCDLPADLASAPMPDDQVLVVWSSACDLHGGVGGRATISGVVLDAQGGVVRGPSVVLAYDRGNTAEPAPLFWLVATAQGVPYLAWVAPSHASAYRRALYISRLDAALRPSDPHEVLSEESALGAIAIACGRACLVAHGRDDLIALRLLDDKGRVTSTSSIAHASVAGRSGLVAEAAGDRFVLGWLESDGVNVDARLATVRTGSPVAVETVARRIPHGDGSDARVPEPLGIATAGKAPALVFETAVGEDSGVKQLHTASRGSVVSRSIDVDLQAGSVVGDDALVAIAGLWFAKPPEPVSVHVP